MKILFVDESSNLQEKWIEPLRGEGWGVVRARSTHDAEKIFEFHGDSLNALVVSEDNVEWAEKWNYPYVVFLKNWKEAQVVKHQNSSSHPATAYLDYDSNLELVKQAITESKSKVQQTSLKATGTSAYSKPASSSSDLVLTGALSAPSTDTSHEKEGGVVISFEKYADQKIEFEGSSSKPQAEAQDNDRTMMLDTTKLEEMEFSPGAEEVSEIQPENKEEIVDVVEPVETAETVNLDAPTDVNAAIDVIEEVQEDHPKSEESFSMESGAEEEVGIDEASSNDIFAEEAPSISYVSNSSSGNKDLETMKSYLALREQDVALLSGQMRSAQQRVQQLETQLKLEKARSGELQNMVQKQEQQIKRFDSDKQIEFEVMHQQIEDLNLQLRERTDKVRTIEAKLKVTTDEVEKVKERVRVDIRRIRVREKELEGQLEILKKDSTALLVARDEKILELKRKIDLLEFNMELVQEQYGKERNQTEQLRHKLKEAAGVMKRAGGLLDHEN